jgi:hypothetical protein
MGPCSLHFSRVTLNGMQIQLHPMCCIGEMVRKARTRLGSWLRMPWTTHTHFTREICMTCDNALAVRQFLPLVLGTKMFKDPLIPVF